MKRLSAVLLTALFLALPATGLAAQQWIRGVTEPYKDATLSSTVSGTIAKIRHREGEAVSAGDVIVELEKDLEELEVERRRLIAESKAELEAARRRVETLGMELEATRHLFETTQSVSREELQQAELDYALAEAELAARKTNEKREDLEYRIARTQLDRRLIRAPFDGIVVKIHLEEGESCNAQEPLVRIVDVSRCRLVTHMQAAASRGLKAGARVNVRIDGVSAGIAGSIEHVSPVVDPSSGMREVKILFDNPNRAVFPGIGGAVLIR